MLKRLMPVILLIVLAVQPARAQFPPDLLPPSREETIDSLAQKPDTSVTNEHKRRLDTLDVYIQTSGDSVIVAKMIVAQEDVFLLKNLAVGDSVKIGTFEGSVFRDLNIKQTDVSVGAIRIEEASGSEAYEIGVNVNGYLMFYDDDGSYALSLADITNLVTVYDSLRVNKTSSFIGDARFGSNVVIEDTLEVQKIADIDTLYSSAGVVYDKVNLNADTLIARTIADIDTLYSSTDIVYIKGALAGFDSLDNVSSAELAYVDGLTSSAQDQITANTTEAEAGAIAGDTATVLRVELQQRILAIPDDSSWAGDAISRTAGTNLVFGNSVYVGADGKLEKTDADAAATSQAIYMVLETIAENSAGLMLWQGLVRADDWTWDEGPVYVSLTTGEYTQTPISADGDQLVKVGIAISATVIQYRAGWTIIEHK